MVWELIIFDCDGVLVDSEFITTKIFAKMVTEVGLTLSHQETIDQFMGRPMINCLEIVEQRLGHALPENFLPGFRSAMLSAFESQLQPIPGIAAALDRITIPTCVASSGDHAKIQKTLSMTGLLPRFTDRIFSAADVKRGKPFPDLFLHAAACMNARPECCAVIEDSLAGVQAGIAAGMKVFGYAKLSNPIALRDAGAHVFDEMNDLPALLDA
jgi:HAD superfamily hydrolase (TIGR01509 family)